MAKYDVIVIGAGAAGLTGAAVLAKNGKRILVVEKGQHLGGRGMQVPFEGFRLNIGGHLLEDPGDGLTQILAYLGKNLEAGPVSSGMPVFHNGRWSSIQEMYASDKSELKKVIKALVDSDYSNFDRWDNKPLREWMLQYTRNEGVIALWEYLAMLECLTENWWDHSASDNLYVRKSHYELRRIAGYSFWPKAGWDGLWGMLADAARAFGAEIRMNTGVGQILVENGRVRGVTLERYLEGRKATPNEFPDMEVAEADVVLNTVPVWDILKILDENLLPDWLVDQIKLVKQDKYKVSWLGLYVATREPVWVKDPLELCAWFHAPRSGLAGWAFDLTSYDPTAAPAGVSLFNCGYAFQGIASRAWLEAKFAAVERELSEMFPKINEKNVIWKRRHLVQDPPFGVIQKPGLVGAHRPEQTVPNIEGLFLAGETYRSRGIGTDRAARSAVTAAEMILGRRITELTGWRY